MRSGELFAGVGGLGMAVDEVFGSRPAWFAEFDEAPSKVLAYHYPDVPNFGDVTKIIDPPKVDILAGGFPCQDVSLAGRRRGLKDGTRSGLWSEFARLIDTIRPEWVVIENVLGLLSADATGDVEPCPWCLGNDGEQHALRALGAVLGDLADLGFDAEWAGLRASDVGAPHGRFRVFILAWPRERTVTDTAGSGRDGRSRLTVGQPVGGTTAAGDSEDARLTLLPTPLVSDGKGGPKDIGRSVFDPQMRDIEQLLPTPVAQPSGNTPEDHLRKKPGREVVTDLAIMAENGLIQSGGRLLLPTPTAGTQSKSSRAMTASRENGRRSGGGQSSPLGLEETASLLAGVRPDHLPSDSDLPPASREVVSQLLPTPGAYDGNRGGSQHPDKRRGGGHSVTIQDVAEHVTDWGPYQAAITRWEHVTGRPAPSPVRYDGKDGKARLNPELTEWMMGWPQGWVTAPEIGLSRAQQLKACGNGVVTRQAATALRELLARPGVPVLLGVAA